MNRDNRCIEGEEQPEEEEACPDLPDTSEEPQSSPAERLGFEPFQYTERS